MAASPSCCAATGAAAAAVFCDVFDAFACQGAPGCSLLRRWTVRMLCVTALCHARSPVGKPPLFPPHTRQQNALFCQGHACVMCDRSSAFRNGNATRLSSDAVREVPFSGGRAGAPRRRPRDSPRAGGPPALPHHPFPYPMVAAACAGLRAGRICSLYYYAGTSSTRFVQK